jgi:hypothetical protein
MPERTDIAAEAETKDGKRVIVYYNGEWGGDLEFKIVYNPFGAYIDWLRYKLVRHGESLEG